MLGDNILVKNRRLFKLLIVIIFILPVLTQNIQTQNNDFISNEELESKNIENTTSQVLDNNIRKSLQFFQTPQILFIVGQDTSLDPNFDQPFYDFMTSDLGYNVTLHTDDNSYDFSNHDAIVISQSIEAFDVVNSLSNVSIPILTMEPFNYDVFRLAGNRGFRQAQTEIALVNTSPHYIIEEFSSQIITVYNQSRDLTLLKDYNLVDRVDEITSLASEVAVAQQNKVRTLVALNKGKLDWLGVPAFERRAFWGGGEGSYLTADGWKIFNKSLHWILYGDVIGNATINVDVNDLSDNPLENARVNLLNLNTSQNWEVNSSISGSASFSGIPYGIYNISINYQGIINNSLANLKISGLKTYETDINLFYSVYINDYVDNSPPSIQKIYFFDTNDTFTADIFDKSDISFVTLNVTVVDGTNGSIIGNGSYPMVTTDGLHYFNDTSLIGIPGSDYIIHYNITAIDVAGNKAFSANQTINLADSTAPTIHEYYATNFDNGTVFFYTNITDNQSSVREVTIRINNSDHSMQFEPSSGFWVYSAEFEISGSLNYTIYSTIDMVGNQGGLVSGSLNPLLDHLIILLSDSQAPHIWGVTDSFNTHEYGFVEITVFIDDWNSFQSGVNSSSVYINFIINEVNSPIPMISLGSIVFALNYQFNFNDSVSYYISVYDFAGNLAVGNLHGNFTIDDTIKPVVNYEVREYGNGTVGFSSLIIDWPSNQTSADLYFTQNFFGTWTNLGMIMINDTYFSITVNNLNFYTTNVWYYIIANDTNGNSFVPTPDQYLNISLTDKVSPIVIFSIENSIINDGEIKIQAQAIDSYGESFFVNNTFQVKITTNQSVNVFDMQYESLFTYSYTQSFFYGETIIIEVFTNDNAGNIGNSNKNIVISDFAPPKINEYGVINHNNGSITIWASIAEDIYGSGLPQENNSIILEYIFQQYFNKTMTWNGTGNFYEIILSGFEPGDSIPFNIIATDKEDNFFQTPTYSEPYFLTIPPEIINYGVDYEAEYVNHATFWINVKYPFGDKPSIKVNISIFDNSAEVSWNNQKMYYNGSHFVFRLDIPYQHEFSYIITINKESKFGSHFVSNSVSASSIQMPDMWAPTILGTGAIQLDDFNILVWAEIIDSGSNISEVRVFYSFESASSSIRLSSTNEMQILPMVNNGSLYVANIPVTGSGMFQWEIFASDNSNSNFMTSFNNQILFIKTVPNSFEDLYLYIILVIISVLIFILIIRWVRKSEKSKHQYFQECSRKLDEIEKIFMINVQTIDGLPILVQKSSVNPQFNIDPLMLSGYISATTTVRSELVSQMQTGEGTKREIISKIEQSSDGKLNVLTTVSDAIIFITFTSASVSNWLQETQVKAHKELKHVIKREATDKLIDDSIQDPANRAISKHLPMVLLEKFSIYPNVLADDDSSSTKYLLKKFLLWHTPIRNAVHKMKLENVNEEFMNYKQEIENLSSFTVQSVREVLVHVFNMKSDKIFQTIWNSSIKSAFIKK